MVLELGGMLVLVLVGIGVDDGVGLVEVIRRFIADCGCSVREGSDTGVGGVSGTPVHKFEEMSVLHAPQNNKITCFF